MSADGVVCGRRGLAEAIVGVDEGKKESGVMVGLEEFSEETEPRVLLCNESNCSSVRESGVEVRAEESECVGDEEREG